MKILTEHTYSKHSSESQLHFDSLCSVRIPSSLAGSYPWKVLGVRKTASMKEITTSYYELAQEHHPDHGGDQGMAFSLIFIIFESEGF